MSRCRGLFFLLLCALPAGTILSATPALTTLSEMILALPGPTTSADALPPRLGAVPSDLFLPSSQCRYESVPGLQPLDPSDPSAGTHSWLPGEWHTLIQRGLDGQNPLATGLATGNTLALLADPRFFALAGDPEETLRQVLIMTYAYQKSGYKPELLNRLYLGFNVAFRQTLPAFLATCRIMKMPATTLQRQLTAPAAIDRSEADRRPPIYRLAVINAQLYSSLTVLSRSLLEERPRSGSAWECLSLLHRSREETARTIQALEQLCRLQPDKAVHQIALARVLFETADADCTNAAARAVKLEPAHADELAGMRRDIALIQQVRAFLAAAETPNPAAWNRLATAVSEAGLSDELGQLLENCPVAVRSNRSWQIHFLDWQWARILKLTSHDLPAVILQPRFLPNLLGQHEQLLRGWFAASLAAAKKSGADPSILPHLAASGLFATLLDTFADPQRESGSWLALKAALDKRYPSGSFAEAVARFIVDRGPTILGFFRDPDSAALGDASSPRRDVAFAKLWRILSGSARDLARINWTGARPRSALALVAGRIFARLRDLTAIDDGGARLRDLVDGKTDPVTGGNPAAIFIAIQKTVLDLFAPGPSPLANLELERAKNGLTAILGPALDVLALPRLATVAHPLDLEIPSGTGSLAERLATLLRQTTQNDAAFAWLKAAVHIRRYQTSRDSAELRRAANLLLSALQTLANDPEKPARSMVRLFNDRESLARAACQNLSFCLAELRHADALTLAWSAMKGNADRTAHILYLLDCRRVANNYLPAPLVREMKEILGDLPAMRGLDEGQKRAWKKALLERLIPLAGDEAEKYRGELRTLSDKDGINRNSITLTGGVSTREGFTVQAGLYFAFFSDPAFFANQR